MKKVLFMTLCAAVMCSCGSKYVVEGNIDGLEGMVYLYQKDNVIDSAAVADGKFRFEGKLEAPFTGSIMDSRSQQPQQLAMQVFIEPGIVSITQDEENPQIRRVTGTPANDAADIYQKNAQALINEFRLPETTDERREQIQEEFEKLGNDAAATNYDNLFGAVLLQQRCYSFSGQEILDEVAKFSPEIQKSKEIEELKKTAEQKMKTDIGQPYINILQSDAEGQVITLTSVIENPANKLTLIDFWASWCGPCMGEVPHLKQTYDKYHSKGFEIYGVSFDKDREQWLGSIKDHNMNWIHVSDLNGFDNPATKDYAIRGIPSNFLIDKDGNIVAKNLRGEELYEKVTELLGE